MQTQLLNMYEVISDGRTVWVNAPTGLMVARFGPFGWEIAQASPLSESQSWMLHPGEPAISGWLAFCEAVASLYGVQLAEEHRPDTVGGLTTVEPLPELRAVALPKPAIVRRLTWREWLWPTSYRAYPWYVPDVVGRWLDRSDQRLRYPRPGVRGWLERTADRLIEIAAAAVGTLAAVALVAVLLRVLVEVSNE